MPLVLPPLLALRAFEAVARHGRMTRAAEELGVTHGAVSRQVRLLEETLKIALFERPRNVLLLTDAGRTLADYLTDGFGRIEKGVASIPEEAEGVLDVSSMGTFAMRWLIPRLPRFAAVCPDVEVRLSQSDAPVDFARARYDVAIRVTDHVLPTGVEVASLFDEQIGPVVAPLLAQKLRLERPEDLRGASLLWARTRPQAWASWCAGAGIEPLGNGQAFEHFYFLLEAAAAGLGVAIGPELHVADDIAAGRLVAPFGFLPSGLSYVALRRSGRNRKATMFCQWIGEEARKAFPASE